MPGNPLDESRVESGIEPVAAASPRSVIFWKLHAFGNNFVFLLHDPAVDYPKLAGQLCRMDTSIGADGLLSLDLTVSPPFVRMWNPDGTPDFCGNGLSCAAKLIQHLTGRGVPAMETPSALVPVRIQEIDACVSQVSIRIRHPTFDPDAIPLAPAHAQALDRVRRIRVDGREFDLIPCSNGNIHTVIFVEDMPTDEDFIRYSAQIEVHPLFPEKTNVLWCRVDEGRLHMRIWERSVGETSSCGTGAAAATAICSLSGYALPRSVEVVMSGGTAHVELLTDAVELCTKATLVFEGALMDLGLAAGPDGK